MTGVYFLKDTPEYRFLISLSAVSSVVILLYILLSKSVLYRIVSYRLIFWGINLLYLIFVPMLSLYAKDASSRFNYIFIIPVLTTTYLLSYQEGILMSILSTALIVLISNLYNVHGLLKLNIYYSAVLLLFINLVIVAIFTYVALNIKTAEEKLRKIKISKDRILESIPSGVITINRDKMVIYTNEYAKKILTPAELERLIDVAHAEQTDIQRKELTINKRCIGYSLRHLPLKEKIIIFQDLTDIKKMEKEQEKNKKLVALGEMAGHLAHEIRNPITTIITASEMLERKETDTKNRNLTQKIMSAAERLNRFATEFLSFTHLYKLDAEYINLNSLISSAVNDFKISHGDAIIKIHAEKDITASIDSVLFKAVLSNLLQNAYEAMQGKSVKQIDIYLQEGEDGFIISIKDKGIGIEKKEMDKIFDIFYTTKTYGTGLGLSIVQKIVALHGGRVEVESQKDSGTTVKLIFPEKEQL